MLIQKFATILKSALNVSLCFKNKLILIHVVQRFEHLTSNQKGRVQFPLEAQKTFE